MNRLHSHSPDTFGPAWIAGLACALMVISSTPGRAADKTAPVVFTGGHETDPQDGGRPVVLIAAALEVTPQVFREAFRGVTPARDGKPSRSAAQANKAALLRVLSPHGVTNDRLDEVSDYYRYRPQDDELWKHTTAKAHAIVEGGKIQRIVVDNPGSGYSSPPKAVVTGFADIPLTATVHFGKDLKTNGSIQSVEIAKSPTGRGAPQ